MHNASDTSLANWARGLLAKKPFKLVAVALVNKIARIAWVIMARNTDFQPGQATGNSAWRGVGLITTVSIRKNSWWSDDGMM